MHVLVVGGGSAGHVLPAVPVIQACLARGDEVTFVGTRTGLEEDLVKDLPITFYGISAGKLRRYFSWQNFTDVLRIGRGVIQSLALLRRVKPQVVFSKGGFVSFPVVVAAWLLRVPVVAHESDLTPGLANRLITPFAARLCTSFPVQMDASAKVVHTGTPLRDEILNGDVERGRSFLGVSAEQPILLVTGGSLGAERLNEAVHAALEKLTVSFFVVHICGPGKTIAHADQNYLQLEYVREGWGDIIAAADLVVSRAGANALFEWLALAKVHLLVPLSAAVSRGDQVENAQFAAKQGLSEVLAEEALTPEGLFNAVHALYTERESYRSRMQELALPDATTAIIEQLDAVARPA